MSGGRRRDGEGRVLSAYARGLKAPYRYLSRKPEVLCRPPGDGLVRGTADWLRRGAPRKKRRRRRGNE